MNIKKLKTIYDTGLISLQSVCNQAGLRYNTIYVKMKRGSELSPEQAEAIQEVLDGLVLVIG